VARYSISDLEQLSGVKAHTIRIWEQRYNLLNPSRTATNIRTYGEADLRRLLNVAALCARGQRISQVPNGRHVALQRSAARRLRAP
jgi:DNA-binding transcriptional MerR regulator